MATSLEHVFSPELLQSILLNPEVVSAKATLDTSVSNKVSFSIPLTTELRSVLQTQFSLSLTNISKLPMRWIKGDTEPHVDAGASKFANTYLVYLNSTPGSFFVGNSEYPITANTGYKFSEGLSHRTQDTGDEPRLLLGPMSEQGFPVGSSAIYYFNNYTDAYNHNMAYPEYPGFLGSSSDYVINNNVSGSLSNPTGSLAPYTNWRVASVYFNNPSYSIPIPSGVYANGFDLATFLVSGGFGNTTFYLYPSAPCFLEGTQILCLVDGIETYVPIEQLKPGALVKTSRDGFKKIELIGKGSLQNPGNEERTENRLYKCSPANYPELKEDLYITGCHSILVGSMTDDQWKETIQHLGKVFVTDEKYRLMACVDRKAEPWCSEGSYTIWHFALENDDIKMNYGVYANGLLVETCSINFMRTKSNMELVV
jgi:hypothetical protein